MRGPTSTASSKRRIAKSKNGKVTDPIYFAVPDEEDHVIAQANAKIDAHGKLSATVSAASRAVSSAWPRYRKKLSTWTWRRNQMVTVAASLIPFLEHDDANRALMGSTCSAKRCTC